MRRIVSFLLGVLRRGVFLIVFVVLIFGSNFLLLTVDAFYDAAKRGLWSVASVVTDVGTATTHRRNREAVVRLATQTEKLEAEALRLNAELRRATSKSAELGTENARLSRRIANLEIQANEIDGPLRERVSAINDRLARRTSRMISTNTSSMAIEAVPYIGAAAIVGVTFMEVRDACLTLADTREMSQLLSGEPEAEVPACGYSPAEFWEILAGGSDATSCRDLSANMPVELRLDCSTILRPGESATSNADSEPNLQDVSRPGE